MLKKKSCRLRNGRKRTPQGDGSPYMATVADEEEARKRYGWFGIRERPGDWETEMESNEDEDNKGKFGKENKETAEIGAGVTGSASL